MKKNLLTLMFVLGFVCVGMASAKTPIPSNNPYQKMSKEDVQAKLKIMNAFVKKANLKCNNLDGCLEKTIVLTGTANKAIEACGADGSNYNSWGCWFALRLVDIAEIDFLLNGCEIPGDFQVTRNNHSPYPAEIDRKRLFEAERNNSLAK